MDAVVGVSVRWQPIAFAFVIRALDRTPWSFTDARRAGMRECEERAVRYGLLERAAHIAGIDPLLSARASSGRRSRNACAKPPTALAAGVVGVPTVLVDGEPYWGDERLETAAARRAA